MLAAWFPGLETGMLPAAVGGVKVEGDLITEETCFCVCAIEILVTAGMVLGVVEGADGDVCNALDIRKALN